MVDVVVTEAADTTGPGRRPPQVVPVQRPHNTPPHETVDVDGGNMQQWCQIRLELMHGANYLDPSAWFPPSPDHRRQHR